MGRGTQVVKLTIQLHLALRLRNSGAIPLPPYKSPMYGRDNFTFTWMSVFMREILHSSHKIFFCVKDRIMKIYS